MGPKFYIKKLFQFYSRKKNFVLNHFKFNRKFTKETVDPVKLNLGCGSMYLDGWINIDENPFEKVDLLINFQKIESYFKPDSVNEAMMIHSLGYLKLYEAQDYFKVIYKLLKPGGKFIIEFPDTAKCARAILDSENDFDKYIEAIRPFYAFDLYQIKKREQYTPYSFGWSAWYITQELKRTGFNEVLCLNPETHGKLAWRDSRIEAKK